MSALSRDSLRYPLAGALFIACLLLAWQTASELNWISSYRFPAPERLIYTCWEVATTGFPNGVTIWAHFSSTLSRILEGYALALTTAIPLGIVIGRISLLDQFTAPIVTFARSVATLSLLPLAIVWFGSGELAKVLLIAYGCFWVMLSNAVAAVKYIDATYITAARTLETGRVGILLRVILPAALPRMFAGARIALGVGFMVIVGAEMIGTVKGLGALVMEARRFYRSDITIAGMILIGVLGFSISTGLIWLERIILPWNRGIEEVRRA